MIEKREYTRLLSEGALLCPRHAEGRWGAALYREPRPIGKDGLEVEFLTSRHWRKEPCPKCIEEWEKKHLPSKRFDVV